MSTVKIELIKAEEKAALLFKEIDVRQFIQAGKMESQLNVEVFALAKEMFGIEKYWHKRIVRSGSNTLHPYDENPADLMVKENDILFFDFGPIFENWEADFGRTYVIGNDSLKHKLKSDIELAWYQAKEWFDQQEHVTGAQYYQYIVELAHHYGWEYGSPIAGHLIGQFPHERLEPGNYGLYVHPENHNDMLSPDKNGLDRNWILEIHFIDRENQIGGFFEQLLTT